MRAAFLALLLLAASPAGAGGRSAAPDDYAQREGNRLSVEVHKLASRNAWTGVERAYDAILELGVQPRRGVYLLAASAARQRGDVAAVRDRLERALALDDTPDVRAWLLELDTDYGELELRARPGGASITALDGSFGPDRRAAVDLATSSLIHTGRFAGMLPAGRYAIGLTEFDVQPELRTRVDLRRRQPSITQAPSTRGALQ